MIADPAAPLHAALRPRRRRLRAVLLGAVVVFAVALVAATISAFVPVPYYALTPGSGVDVARLVAVPRALGHVHVGNVLLTDIELVPLHALSYLYYELDSQAQVVGDAALVGSATSAQYEQQGVVDMFNARQAATIVALRQLGYRVRGVPDGVTVYQLEPGSVAGRGLKVGDVIEAVNRHPTRTIAGLESVLGRYRPGTAVELSIRALLTGRRSSARLRLGEVRIQGTGNDVTEVCAPPGTDTSLPAYVVHGSPAACLGIYYPEQAYATDGLPFKVAISADSIVGPSAGLAFTLGLIEKLDSQDLTAGLKVAATGTIAVDGAVGDVGGVAQKTIAVRAAGASVFFVPPPEYAVALANAGPSLKVIEVATIGQAVTALEHLGGRLSPPSSRR